MPVKITTTVEPNYVRQSMAVIQGMNAGGAAAQVWTKLSDAPYDADWRTPPGGGGPGVTTNLSITYDTVKAVVANTNGTGFNITAATASKAGAMTAANYIKLDGIAAEATKNEPDSYLLNRSNHQGSQASNTISDFAERVQDVVAAFLQPGSNVSFVHDDPNNTFTINASPGGGGGATNLSLGTITGTTVAILSDTGTDVIIPAASNTTAGVATAAQVSKLEAIEDEATKNETDSYLIDRGNHTGSQGISTITGLSTALAAKVETSLLGSASGIATLGPDSKVLSSQLPSYVDDVLEFANLAAFPVTGEAGKIYVALDTNVTYRWGGSVYVEISSGPVLSVNSQTGVVTLTKADVGLGSADNTSDATKNAAAATLANKTMSGVSNTFSDIPQSAITDLTTALGGKQDSDADLAAIAALSGTGLPRRTGANAWTMDASSYLTGNQTITFTGDVGGTGTTAVTLTIDNNAVTNAKLATMATASFKGRTTAGTGSVEDLSATQATALLNVFNYSDKGLVPPPGGSGATKFLREDQTWQIPEGGGGGRVQGVNDFYCANDWLDVSTAGAGIWQGTSIGSGGVGLNVPSSSRAVKHPGITLISNGTAVNTGYILRSNNANILTVPNMEMNFIFNMIATAASGYNTNTVFRMGFLDSATAAESTDGLVLCKDAGSMDIFGKVISNGTAVISSAIATLSAETWYHGRVKVNGAGTECTFTLYAEDGTSLGSQTITTGLPVGASRLFGSGLALWHTTETSSRSLMHLDFMDIYLPSLGRGSSV